MSTEPWVRRDVEAAFTPTYEQWIHFYTLFANVFVLLVCWNMKYVRILLLPFKFHAVVTHESCHAIMGVLTGATVEKMLVDPDQGGATAMRGGWLFLALPAGYIGSSCIGAAYIFASFDQFASEVACAPVLAISLVICWFARKDWLSLCTVLFADGLIVLLYFVAHGVLLPFLIAFLGVVNCMYAIWDTLDDLVFRKVQESDCSVFAREYPWFPSQVWGAIWWLFSLMALCAGTLGGLCLFKHDFAEQAAQAATYGPN